MTKRKVDRETVLKVCKVLGVVLVCAIAFAYAVVYIVRQGRFSESYSPDEGHYIAMAQRLLTEGYYSYWRRPGRVCLSGVSHFPHLVHGGVWDRPPGH